MGWNLRAKAVTTGAIAVLGVAAATGTAQARDVTLNLFNNKGQMMGYAMSYGANGAAKVCDVLDDGVGATLLYLRVDTNGTPGRVYVGNGPGLCRTSTNLESNPIATFTICPGNSTIDCDPWKWTNRS